MKIPKKDMGLEMLEMLEEAKDDATDALVLFVREEVERASIDSLEDILYLRDSLIQANRTGENILMVKNIQEVNRELAKTVGKKRADRAVRVPCKKVENNS